MECPKCGLEIDDKAMFCPNCKKVLKLACPICKTINTTNTCRKCGYVIISKCSKCGKVNQTITKKCKKCGFDTEKSVILNESNTDDYAMVRIEFPNVDEMKQLLGSAKLYNKFRINLDNIILEYTRSVGLRCRIINKSYIIRCYKDYTFKGSVSTAINTVIELLNRITEMNCKLTKKKNASIHCNVVITQKNTNNDSAEIDEGFNVNLLYQTAKNKEERILNTFQVLGDDAVCNVLGKEYRISPLNSIMSNGKLVMISEIDIKNFVKVEFPEDDEDSHYQDIEIPNFVQNMLVEQDKIDGDALHKMETYKPEDDDIYDIDTINFDEIKCDFLCTENSNVIFHIMNKFQSSEKSIIALKTPDMYKPYTIKILNAAFETQKFDNIISITCYGEMKYSPYSFFKDLVATVFEYTVSQKLFSQNDFSMFSSVDPDGLIKDLISMRERQDENLENTRYIYYDIFLTIFKIIPKTLIYIEDFDKIDDSSLDVMKYIFESFDSLDLSILLSYDKEYSLHRECNYLLSHSCYTEITLKPDSFENLIENEKVYYKDILNDFYFQRIAKYSCGSSLFIDIAIQYLIESDVYSADDTSIKMVNPKTIIIPSNLDKLVSRRINLLQDKKSEMKLLTYAVLLGPRTDMATINCLGIKYKDEVIENLSNMGYVYVYNNCLHIPNYNLVRKNLLSALPKIYLQDIAKELLKSIFDENSIPSYSEAHLYNILNDKDRELKELEDLAKVDLSLGDFNAYVNCCEKIIQLLNDIENPDNADEILERKNDIYSGVAEFIQDSEKYHDFAESILENIEKSTDIDKIIRLCNKMINSSLKKGNFGYALELMHKVLALLPPSSINPADENFNKYFFLMSIIHIQILYNIGALKDCIEIGYKVLSVITDDTIEYIKPDYYDIELFKDLVINSAAYVAFANVILMTNGLTQYLNILRSEMSFIPQSFDLFIALEDFIHGRELSVDIDSYDDADKYGNYIKYIIKAFLMCGDDYSEFAETFYKAKIIAQSNDQRQLELFADLMIAYAYVKRDSAKKAEHILNQILKETHNNGMTNVLYATWFIMSELYLSKNKYNIAYGIINNSQIQLERNNNASEYLLMLFKYNLYKIMMFKKDFNKAELCINQAIYIANKYGINFDFTMNKDDYESTDSENDEITEDNVVQEENTEGE